MENPLAVPGTGNDPDRPYRGDATQAALDLVARLLERGELFGIYPEGTRSRDGLLHKGRTGAARLALRSGAPIIPVGIRGTDAIMPPEYRLPRPLRRASIAFGAPIDPGHYDGRHDERLVLRQVTDEVMFEIGILSGQTYEHTYATTHPSVRDAALDLGADEVEVRSSVELLRLEALPSSTLGG